MKYNGNGPDFGQKGDIPASEKEEILYFLFFDM